MSGKPSTWLVAGGALLLFGPTVLALNVQTTDLSALRVLGGETLYRDMWTMYAPGSIYAMALAYGLFGSHMIVGNLLGILVSTGSVAALHRLGLRLGSSGSAAVVAAVFAFAFFGAGYQNSLASYPPAILLIFLGFDRLARHAERGERGDLLWSGLCLGLAAVFKHDVAAYACLAAAMGLVVVPGGPRAGAVGSVLVLATVVLAVVAVPLVALIALGAGPGLLDNLVVFPSTYFRHVRPEAFPILPPLDGGGQALWWWLNMNAPSWALILGLPGVALGWSEMPRSSRRVVVMSVSIFVLFWIAAHVQANTHRISMAGFGALVGVTGVLRFRFARDPEGVWVKRALASCVTLWCLAMFAPTAAVAYTRGPGLEFVGLPRLGGMLTDPETARQLRELSEALETAGPPEAPTLQLGWRNDVLIYADATPYWLTDRRMITPFHELHPGVTDIERGQRRMLEDLAGGPLPVLVREHRFAPDVLDRWGAIYREAGVPVGATLLDEWVDANYEAGERIGMYEVMRARR